MRKCLHELIILSLCVCAFLFSFFAYGEDIKSRFHGKERLIYTIYFNGVPSGTITWTHSGQGDVNGKTAEVIGINSDTNILKLLNLESQESVFLDTENHLPLKVERDLVFFGKKEIIEEIYNQQEGYVEITKQNSSLEKKRIYQKKPIYHILSLLYFFPKNIDLIKGDVFYFNLPTQKVKVKVDSYRTLYTQNQKYETYFLLGRGGRNFNIWLDKKDRVALRVEFFVPVGKITIVKKT